MIGDQEVSAGFSTIEITGNEAFAGADIVLTAGVVCDPPCDLRGHILEIRDETGESLGEARVATYDDAANFTEQIIVKVPAGVEEATWQAVLAGHVTNGIVYPETSSSFAVRIKPHRVYMSVWDIPYAVNSGEQTKIRVGVKCGAGCKLSGVDLNITDDDGNDIATGETGLEPWQDTDGLYAADIEVIAPKKSGQYRWHARLPAVDQDMPHDEGHYAFTVRVMPKPEVTVSIEAVSHTTGKPVSGARVVMHPYRTQTDDRGIAQIRVAKGDYTIMVSKTKYDPMSTSATMEEDYYSRVELVDEEPEFNPDENY